VVSLGNLTPKKISKKNLTPNKKLILDIVKDGMLNEEARRKESGKTSEIEEGAFVTEKQGNRGSRNDGKGFRKEVICHYCNMPGHYKRECRKWKKDQSRFEGGKDEKDPTTAIVEEDVCLVFADDCVSPACQKSTWVIDSGTSFHVTSHRDFFSTYTSGNFGCVRMGNISASKIIGMGDIFLEFDVGRKITLKDVRHVPDIRLNLISTGKLDGEGYDNYFGEGKWKLIK